MSFRSWFNFGMEGLAKINLVPLNVCPLVSASASSHPAGHAGAGAVAATGSLSSRSRSLQDLPPEDDISATPGSIPNFNATDLLGRDHDFVAVYLSNAKAGSDTGLSSQVDLALELVSKIHLNGDGPQYYTVHISDNLTETVHIVQELYDAGVRVFVGPETSSQAVALADWAESEEDPKEDAIFFTFWASNPGLSLRPSIVQLIPSDVHLVSQFLSLRTFVPGRDYISVIHDDGVYAMGIARLLQERAHHLLAAQCQVPFGKVTPEQAKTCIRDVMSSSPPENTMVILLTGGDNSRVMFQAAYDVYGTEAGYSGNSNGEVMWVGGDGVAFDVSVFDDADVDTGIWKGAQIVNLNAITPGGGPIESNNDLAIKWWNDFASFLGRLQGDDVVPSSDVSPIVMFAADIAALLFLNAGGVVTGAGVNREELRITLLRQTPFLTTHSGPLRFTNDLQRAQTPYIVTGIVKTAERPSLADGIWVAKRLVTAGETGTRFDLQSTSGIGIVPPRHMLPSASPNVIVSRNRRLKEPLFHDTSFDVTPTSDGNPTFMAKFDNMFTAYHGARGTTIWDTTGKPMKLSEPFPRRLRDEGSVGFSKILVRSTIGDHRIAFQPSGWASNNCLRQIERTTTIADIAAAGSSGSVPVCGLSQRGFVLSVVDANSNATLSDLADCRHDELLAAAIQALQESDMSNQTTAEMNCVQSQVLYSESVGAAAMWGNSTCGESQHGFPSLGEAYRNVDPSLFVSQGAAKPLPELPGLLRSFLETSDADADGESTTAASRSGSLLDAMNTMNLREKPFVSHVRGEDWACSCGYAGEQVSCVQMYRLMECPREAPENSTSLDLERDCCILPQEVVTCTRSDPITCSNSILEYMDSRDATLASRNTQIALHPQAAFEGYRLPQVLLNATDAPPFIADFQLDECTAYDMGKEEDVFVAEEDVVEGKDEAGDDRARGLGEETAYDVSRRSAGTGGGGGSQSLRGHDAGHADGLGAV